ncbi:MAG: hypothetical protein EOO09_05765 [Chitinophagaceae bacterium]|nr:MAG: hypothetical protein EOO09_05765 [Chitinophagaceae bacterium]
MRSYRFRGLRKTLGIYLLVGSAGLLAYDIWQAGLAAMMGGISPAVSLLFILFYFSIGLLVTIRPLTPAADRMLKVALLLQAAGFSVYGLFFRCAFAPVAGLTWSTTTRSPFGFEWQPFAFGLSAGFEPGVDAASVSINLVPLAFLLLLFVRGKKL